MSTGPTTRKWLRRGAELALLAAVVLGVRAYQQAGMAEGMAPPLDTFTIHGDAAVAPAQDGRPTLVHFWASWCPVCAAEQGNIQAVAEDHTIITIAMQSGNDESVRAHLEKEGLTFPVVNDPDGAIARKWGVKSVPATFVVDGGGQIRTREVGYTTEAGLRLRLWLAR